MSSDTYFNTNEQIEENAITCGYQIFKYRRKKYGVPEQQEAIELEPLRIRGDGQHRYSTTDIQHHRIVLRT